MKKSEFDKWLKRCTTKDVLDPAKVQQCTDEELTRVTEHIVRHRGPVVEAIIPKTIDRSWLASCGYFHKTTSRKTGLVFVHTAEHEIK